jgi:hypothetical protein
LPEVQQVLGRSQGLVRKLFDAFQEYPVEETAAQHSQQASNPYQRALAGHGITTVQFLEVLKVLGLFPSLLAKHEVASVYVQSLGSGELLSPADFPYALFLLFAHDHEKKGNAKLIEDPKLAARVQEFVTADLGENALKKIREHHNNIIVNQINNKTFFGKHYSVNIKASIM